MLHCYHCGTAESSEFIGRQDVCATCGRDLRVCRNCRHYDRTANNECREEQAGRQVDKEKANFCEWFQISAATPASGNKAPTRDDLKNAAANLFKKKP